MSLDTTFDVRSLFDAKAARASARELHHKSKACHDERRRLLAIARQTCTPEDYAAFYQAHHAAFERGQCHCIWRVIDAWLRDVPFSRVDGGRDLAHDSAIAQTAMEVLLDEHLRLPRNGSVYEPGKPEIARARHHLWPQVRQAITAWREKSLTTE